MYITQHAQYDIDSKMMEESRRHEIQREQRDDRRVTPLTVAKPLIEQIENERKSNERRS